MSIKSKPRCSCLDILSSGRELPPHRSLLHILQTSCARTIVLQADRIPQRWQHRVLLGIVFMLWGCIFSCLLAWWALYGEELHQIPPTAGFQGFVTVLDPRAQVGFFNAILPMLMLGVSTRSLEQNRVE